MKSRRQSKRFSRARRVTLTSSQKSQVNQIINRRVETKLKTGSFNGTAIDNSTGAQLGFADIAQGSSNDQRNGTEVELRRFTFEGVLTFPDSTNVIRCIVCTTPDNVTGPGGYYPAVYTPLDTQEAGIKVWRDFLICGGNPAGPAARRIKLDVPFHKAGRSGMKLKYYDTTGTSHVMGNPGRPWLFFISDSGAVTHPTITGHAKCWYKDA